MATEQERLQVLVNAGVATEADKARLRELIVAGETVETLAPIKEAKAAAPAIELGEVITIHLSNIKKFKEGAEYSITKEGLFWSKLAHYFEPATEKPQMWFVFESDDNRVKPANRGIYVGEYGAGSGILRTLLDALRIKYELDEDTENLIVTMPKLPVPCWAEWSKDSKGIGGVKISGIKSADTKIEQLL